MQAGSLKHGGSWIRDDLRLAIYIRDGFTCGYCGCDLRNATPRDVTLDHLTTRSAGGANDPTNLHTACRSCNSARGERPFADYASAKALRRIERNRYAPVNRALAKAILAGTSRDPRSSAVA